MRWQSGATCGTTAWTWRRMREGSSGVVLTCRESKSAPVKCRPNEACGVTVPGIRNIDTSGSSFKLWRASKSFFKRGLSGTLWNISID